MKQKQDILNALQSGSGVHIKPTIRWTLLASIGIEYIKKITGKGAPRIGKQTHHFIVFHHMSQVMVKKKNNYQKKNYQKKVGKWANIGKKQPIQWNTNNRGNTLKFHKDIPLSNHDLIKWCRYLNIPIKDVLSRYKRVPRNHRQALFIYNLEPSYMSGSHWVATYVKDNINYY